MGVSSLSQIDAAWHCLQTNPPSKEAPPSPCGFPGASLRCPGCFLAVSWEPLAVSRVAPCGFPGALTAVSCFIAAETAVRPCVGFWVPKRGRASRSWQRDRR
eukprot:366470-Chlamydomonas_euryale.AAC.12